ncbi:MAG: radical SAM protein [Desulforhopalus sp.]|jgi:putative pyruvate formate lyase activating enzyme|nr:radical SAM protein [Desulforhopalus sp.]
MAEPGYRRLHASGQLAARAEAAVAALCACTVCPRECRVNRLEGETGFCAIGRWARVASFGLHFGEEQPLVGTGGSGTIFFARCNLACVFCQNQAISQEDEDSPEAGPGQLAAVMLDLQRQGAHNINLVTPSHLVPQILEALIPAVEQGLNLPLVYNTSGYDTFSTLRWLDGLVDIYLPDAKFFSPETAGRYCGAPDYPQYARQALREMHRQVGDLKLDSQGLALRGLLVRHLVMPGDLAETARWMEFFARELSLDTYLNVMDQYRPCGRLTEFPELGRSITAEEFQAALASAAAAGIRRLDQGHRHLAARLRQLLREGG